MKIWIKTKIIGTGTEKDSRRAYINQTVSVSMMELENNKCLCRVAGTAEQISVIIADVEITELTDEEAQSIIKTKYPNSDLENTDISDLEIDEIAKSHGLDPKIRADIIIPTRGKQLLQDQENYLMSLICERISLSKDYWDTDVAKTTKWKKGIDIEHDIKDGKGEAHEFVLSKIRDTVKGMNIKNKKTPIDEFLSGERPT